MKRSTFAWTIPSGSPLTEAQRQLVTEALPLMPAVVGEVLRMRPSARHFADELPSVAAEGLLWAVQRFNPDRGTRWASYAFWGARMRCLSWVKAAQLRDGDAFLDAQLPTDDSDGSTLADILPGAETPPDELALQRRVLDLVRQLPDRERVAIQRVFTGQHLSEVGRATGRSAEMVRKWELSGLRILRGELGLEPKQKRPAAPPLDARERFSAALRAGGCTVTDLCELTGYTRMGVLTRLHSLGAVQAGSVVRNGRATPLWVLPAKAA